MRLKLDENMPARLAASLGTLGHDAETTPNEGLSGHDDPVVWKRAQAEGRFLITQDLDFSDLRRFTPGTHAGILLVRLRTPGRMALIQRVADLFSSENVNEWSGCLVIATDQKLRVRRP